jgi:curved DNA-binding protein CbpA
MANNPNLLEVLLDLHKTRRSGVLRVERGSEKKQLVLSSGLLAFAESNQPEEHLARIMVKLGLMPQAKVKEIASLMKAGKTCEEAVLALSSSGMQDFEKGRREQATVILASLLGRGKCNLRFYPGEDLIRRQHSLGMSLPELIVLSARRAVSGRFIPNPPSFSQEDYSIAENFAGTASVFPLNSAEAYAFSLLHESTNTADILPLIPATEAKPEDILMFLWVLGLIARKEPVAGLNGSFSESGSDSVSQDLDDMLARFESAGLYEILSVPADASPDQIQTAYYDLARQYHPDRFQSKNISPEVRSKAEKAFTLINEAYTTLKDPVFRTGYDEKRLTKESKVEAELKARAAKKSEDEKTAEGLYRDGRTLLSKGDFEKAVERFKGSVWLCPEKAVYHHYLGVAQSEIPSLRKSSEQHLLKAIELEKASTASHLELAKLYIKVMLRRKAEQQLQELLRWDPENREAHRLFAELKNMETAAPGLNIKNPFTRS